MHASVQLRQYGGHGLGLEAEEVCYWPGMTSVINAFTPAIDLLHSVPKIVNFNEQTFGSQIYINRKKNLSLSPNSVIQTPKIGSYVLYS